MVDGLRPNRTIDLSLERVPKAQGAVTPMTSRARKTQKLYQGTSSDSTKHARTSHDNEEYSNQRDTEDGESSEIDDDFAAIGTGEFLELDPRPTFIVTSEINFDDGIEPIYTNEALRSNHQLMKVLVRRSRSNSPPTSPKASTLEFRAWLKHTTSKEGSEAQHSTAFSFCGHLWSAFTVQQRWIVISGTGNVPEISGSLPLRSESPNTPSRQQSETSRVIRQPRNQNPPSFKDHFDNVPPNFVTPGTPDWTLAQPEGDLSPHVIFARSVDWASTSLGDMNT